MRHLCVLYPSAPSSLQWVLLDSLRLHSQRNCCCFESSVQMFNCRVLVRFLWMKTFRLAGPGVPPKNPFPSDTSISPQSWLSLALAATFGYDFGQGHKPEKGGWCSILSHYQSGKPETPGRRPLFWSSEAKPYPVLEALV